MKTNIYLNFDGNCEEAFLFYKSVFQVEFFMNKLMRFSEVPNFSVSEEYKNKIMHVAIELGENMIMGSDVIPENNKKIVMGNNFYITIYPKSKKEADELFKKLSESGNIESEMNDTFFGYYGAFTDKFGIQWMIVINNF